jgi:DNA processing protein
MSRRPQLPADERQAWMVLNAVEGWGPISGRKMLAWAGGDWRAIFAADEETLLALVGRKRADSLCRWHESFEVEREEARLAASGGRFVIPSDPDYPARLKGLPDAPLGLYWQGRGRLLDRSIAIVGTRHATPYGSKVTRQFARELARAGFTVVSGLALGIDAEAHAAVLEGGGSTLAVLGHGLDVVYPAKNAPLFRRMREEAALVSEFPFGRRPDRQTFPQRNRIVSGMTLATIVVESGRSGGSLITAKFAMEQNRTVFAVPGRIDQPHSRGCLDLIRDGATLLTSVDEVLEELNFMQLDLGLETGEEREVERARRRETLLAGLGEDERGLLVVLGAGESLHLDQLCERTGLPSFRVHAALMMLELQRLVRRGPGGLYEGNL